MKYLYYNIACYDDLHGSKIDALTAFEKSAKRRYSNYTNTIADTNLGKPAQGKCYWWRCNSFSNVGYYMRR
ncbi:hypothetical protein INP83_12115 [Mucilaginibacter sp. 21P]|uniref:hypothetical protein n=1 Tax=Mucilaginibacter sp. 21P TaxID=2778902 RepID=UPI001C58EF84|nr:hypothetical protein [Mucilaginibacter sp. 21P]QXV63850.1 hypothetical protein INP83_12115 [Mucilaginibacter sp. 21P]